MAWLPALAILLKLVWSLFSLLGVQEAWKHC